LPDELSAIGSELQNIPREDAGVYLVARMGNADYFISANYKLVRAIVDTTKEFECLTPQEFCQRYGVA
jgi:predicted nucleic acid-binding protein